MIFKKGKGQRPQEKSGQHPDAERSESTPDAILAENGPAPELRIIKKRIKKRNIRLVFAAAAICLGLVLVFQFAISPLLNLCFYRPTEKTYAPNYSYTDFELGLDAFTELHFPGRRFYYAKTENTGIGSYRLDFVCSDWKKTPIDYSVALVRGRFTIPAEFWYGATTVPTFAFTRSDPYWESRSDAEELAQELQESTAYLKTLPDYVLLEAHLSFRDDRSMEELAALYNQYAASDGGPALIWAGIRNNDSPGQGLPQTGLNPAGYNEVGQINEHYPAFNLPNAMAQQEGKADGALYETHFRSLLNYLIDHPGFLKALGGDIDRKSDYKNIASYIESSGIYTYGVTAVGTPSAILAFCQKEGIEKIQIEDLTFRRN